MNNLSKTQIDAVVNKVVKKQNIQFLQQYQELINQLTDKENYIERETLLLSLCYNNSINLIKDCLYQIFSLN